MASFLRSLLVFIVTYCPVDRGVATALYTLQLERTPQARGPQVQQCKKILDVTK